MYLMMRFQLRRLRLSERVRRRSAITFVAGWFGWRVRASYDDDAYRASLAAGSGARRAIANIGRLKKTFILRGD